MPIKGIWQWVWVSIPPGMTSLPPASMVVTPSPTVRLGPTSLGVEGHREEVTVGAIFNIIFTYVN